jgi:hypothetical protein
MRAARQISLALLTALAAQAEPRVASSGSDTPHLLAIVLTFEQAADDLTLEHTERELEYIFRPLGLRIQWRMGIEDRQEEVANLLISVRMQGRCSMMSDAELKDHPANLVLGRTETSEGEPLSYCAVDCDSVRAMIRAEANRESYLVQQRLLGRALARVLAHEMYHILAGTVRHFHRGITKPVLRPDELVGGPAAFEPEELEAIRRALPRPRSRPDPVPSGGGDGR